jgi:hypothetical protein
MTRHYRAYLIANVHCGMQGSGIQRPALFPSKLEAPLLQMQSYDCIFMPKMPVLLEGTQVPSPHNDNAQAAERTMRI